jgi:hypothetical protein
MHVDRTCVLTGYCKLGWFGEDDRDSEGDGALTWKYFT